MKKTIFSLLACSLLFISCATSNTGGAMGNATQGTIDLNYSINEFDLVLADEPVTYQIDISTEEGKLVLSNSTPQAAAEYTAAEAARINKCDVIFKAKCTYLKSGNRLLRMRVNGRPANYKNKNK